MPEPRPAPGAPDTLAALHFTEFAERLHGPAWIKDLDGRYVYLNQAAARTFGRTREEIRDRTDRDLFPPETATAFRANDRLALADPTGIEVIERLTDRHGRIRNSIVSKFPIAQHGNGPVLVGGIAMDITEWVEAEEALRQTDRRKSEFLATLAHELRNPLAPIRNALHILRLADGAGAQARVHDILEQQLQRMVRLVDDLLEVSRISSGRIELRKEFVALGPIIESAIETNRPLFEAERQRLTVTVPETPMLIHGDAVRLAQALSNLLNNASKYALDGGEIEVRAWAEQGEARVAVIDDGLGIPVEMLPRVFEMFTQIDSTLKRPQSGLGVGMALTRDLIEMHGGMIDVYSQGLNRGSEFVVRLPLVEHMPERLLLPADDVTVGGEPRRILVVDDNRDGADSLAMVLRLMGAEVMVAYDGPAALEAIAEHRPSAVLLDIGMPGMDGFEVAAAVRVNPAYHDIRLIALTGWGSADMRARSEAAGFNEHWVKPVDPEQLRKLSVGPGTSQP